MTGEAREKAQASKSEAIPVEGSIYDDRDSSPYRRTVGGLSICLLDCEMTEQPNAAAGGLLGSIVALARS